jgi:RNA polymerase sigma-70 factor (ECF subfamily)
MERCLKQLPESQRKCLVQFYLHGKSYGQIELELGLSYKEVKSNIQNGKRMLRKKLLDSRNSSNE